MKLFLSVIFALFFVIPFTFAETSNLGEIYWKHEIVSNNSFVDIYVNDDDMNKKEYPNFADKFTITVWSDTSPNGLEIQVIETGVYSGIFKGSVYISDSGEATKNRLISNPGDILYAKYVDTTLPNGNVSEIISAAVVKISGQNMESILMNLDPSLRHNTDQNKVPDWVKNNAGWWAEGAISESEFLSGISFLVSDGIITVPPTTVSESSAEGVPDWVKNNAGWWAEGAISDNEFVNGIQHLMKVGLVSVSSNAEYKEKPSSEPTTTDPELIALEAELEKCSEIKKAYKRIDCEKPIKKIILLNQYKANSEKFEIGPMIYYWQGLNSEGNMLEITPTGQPILTIRMLAENVSSEISALNCTSPLICAYDVWDGSKAYKYSGMDFTSGQIVLNPGDSREFNILFGPNIGYGGTKFEFDPLKTYVFRINENFGNVDVPLNLE